MARALPQVFSSSLVTRLILGTLCLDLLVAGFAARTLYVSHANYEKRALVATQNLSKVLAQDLAASFSKIELALLAVKEEMERQLTLGRVHAAPLNAYIARQAARQPDLNALRVADAEGNVIFGSGVGDGPPVNAAQRDFFMRLRETPGPGLFVSRPMIGQISGRWSVVLARRVDLPGGGFGGAVYAVVLLETIQKQFAALDLGPHGALSLRDLDLGTVVRHPEPAAVGTAIGNRTFSREWPEKLKENALFGSYFAVGLDGLNRALSYRRVADYPFYVIVGQYPGDYLAEWEREMRNTLGLAGAFVLVTCWFAWLVALAWRRREADARLREEERERLMLDLHDGCIQSIYAVGLRLENVRRQIDATPANAAKGVGEALADLNLVIQELRAFIAGKSPESYSPDELIAEIHRIIPQLGPAGPQFSVDIDRAALAKLSPERADHLLRIAREGVSNVVRHANAKRATLSLRLRGAAVHLEVSDDGTGIGAGAAAAPGLGLHHIEARARKLGGRASVHSTPAKGTRIAVEFPAMA
jgi:signal transduction histidine kinase